MKHIAKRLLVSLLCGLMLLPMFTSCNSSDGESTETSSETEAVAATTTAPAKTTAAATTNAPEPEKTPDPNWVSAVFGGGPFVTGGTVVANRLKRSGFNTIMIWSVHVHDNGNLVINDVLVCENGEYVGDPKWSDAWKSLKEGDTSVTRVELSVGAWSCPDFENIRALIERDGTGEDTVLYRNFKALIEAANADAINYDDESCYDVDNAVKFGKMCESMGVKVTLCPYTNKEFWVQVEDQLGDELVDRIYLQCYSGGAGNDPLNWELAFGRKVIPGYWGIHGGSGTSAAAVGKLLANKKSSITGGFMWLYDELQSNGSPNSVNDYAAAINGVSG